MLWPSKEGLDTMHSPQIPEILPGWQGETFRSEKVFQSLRAYDNIRIISWKRPRAFLFENFLTHKEADHLIALATPFLTTSLVSDDDTGELMLSKERTSTSTFLNRTQDDVIKAIEERIAQITYLPVENQEPFEVLHYGLHQKAQDHYDYFHDNVSIANGGQRVATALMYLADVEKGGETAFFDPDVTWSDKHCLAKAAYHVKPRKGDVLLFWNAQPDGSVDTYSLHGSCPVTKGDKWTATKWIRASMHDPDGGPVSPY